MKQDPFDSLSVCVLDTRRNCSIENGVANLCSASSGGESGRRRIAELNGLRGLAILMVFLFHYVAIRDGGSLGYRVAVSIVKSLWCGVDLFFVLSGFLITGVLLNAKSQANYFLNFFVRRGLRILPLYFAIATIVFLLLPTFCTFNSAADRTLLKNQGWVWCFAVNVKTALSGFYPFLGDKVYLHHLWSLAVEEQFYLIWPFIVYACSRIALRNVCIICLVAAPLVRIGLLFTPVLPLASYTLTFCRMDALAAGALLSLFFNGPSERKSRNPVYWLVLPSTSILIILCIWRGGLSADDWPVRTIGFTLLWVAFAGFISMALVLKEPHPFRKTLRSNTLQALGKYSYGLYIIHVALFPTFRALLTTGYLQSKLSLPYVLAGSLRIILVFFSCMVLALASWILVERYPLRLKRYF